MRALQFSSSAGGVENNIRLNESASLPPSAESLKQDQILIKVLSASLNPADYKLWEAYLLSFFVKKNTIPGMDFAGKVIATGPFSDVKTPDIFTPGQLVFGRFPLPQSGKFGTFAEYVVVRRGDCVPIPEGVDINQAAAVGTAGLTAYQSIKPYVKSGQRIFINGGSGGVGTFAIQIAKALGCHVITSCSTPNVEFCKDLGADQVLDYKKVDLVQELKKLDKVDHIVDFVNRPADLYWKGHEFATPSTKFLEIAGEASLGDVRLLISRLIWPGFLGGGKLSYAFFVLKNKPEDFVQMGDWLLQGKVKSVIAETFPFSQEGAVRAITLSKTKRTRGKIVINISDNTE